MKLVFRRRFLSDVFQVVSGIYNELLLSYIYGLLVLSKGLLGAGQGFLDLDRRVCLYAWHIVC